MLYPLKRRRAYRYYRYISADPAFILRLNAVVAVRRRGEHKILIVSENRALPDEVHEGVVLAPADSRWVVMSKTRMLSAHLANWNAILIHVHAACLPACRSKARHFVRTTGNEHLYGKKMAAVNIVRKNAVLAPEAAQNLIGLLTKYSPRNSSNQDSLE